MPAPVIEDAGFDPLGADEAGLSGGHLWVRLAPSDPLLPSTYVMELVGGRAPRGIADWWGRPIAADGDYLVVPIAAPMAALDLTRSQPFVFGFQVRGLDGEGRAGAASMPVWISFDPTQPARALTGAAPRSDHVLFFLLAVGLGILWYWYRREPAAESKIRLAGLVALGSVVFLSVTAAMPWLLVDVGEAGRGASLECLLGQEVGCVHQAGPATLAAAAGDPSLLARVAFEVQRWQCASAALRMGQVTALALLLPALIWLLVDPRHRAAQAAAAVGASVAGFVLMVVLLYRHSVPSWLGAELYWTSDIALMTTSNIVIAAVLIIRQSFSFLHQTPLPAATARYRRDRD
jgi:heme/copper-type cytochrome/quinol oxidase subunit 4